MAKGTIPYYTQLGLARKAGVGKTAVSQAVRRKQIAIVRTRDGVAPLIEASEAERWLRERRPAHRPKSDVAGDKK